MERLPMKTLIQKFRSETPSWAEIQRDMFKSGFAPLFAAVFFQVIPFLDEKVVLTVTWRIFLLIAFATPAVLHFWAAIRLKQKSRRGVILAQSATAVMHAAFAAVIIALAAAPGSPLSFLTDQLLGFDANFLLLIFVAVVLMIATAKGVVCGFYIRYIGRLKKSIKDGASSVSDSEISEPSSFFIQGLRDMVIRTKEPGEDRYRQDLLPFTRNSYSFIAPVFAIAGIFLVSWLLSAVFQTDMSSFIMPPVMVIIALLFIYAPKYFVKRPSVFENGRKPIQSVDEFSARLILYEDGIEFREYFSAYFVPYDKIIRVSGKKGFFESVIRIETQLPGVPSELLLNSDKAADILEAVKHQSEMFLRNAGERERAPAPEIEKQAEASPERPLERKPVIEKIETEKQAPKKIIIAVISVQILFYFLLTPAWVALKRIIHDPSQENVRLYSPDEYHGQKNPPPKAVLLIEVEYADGGDVLRETYYTALGDKYQRTYRNGETGSMTSFTGVLLAIYTFSGLGLIVVGMNFDKRVLYIGVAMFGTVFALAAINFILQALQAVAG